MANFDLGTKILIINSASDATFKYYTVGASGNTEVTVAADRPVTGLITIDGFGSFLKANITKVVKAHGIAGQKQVSTETVTFPGTPTVGSEIILKVKFKSENLEAEFAKYDLRYTKEKYYQLIVASGETVSTLAAKVKTLIDADVAGGYSPITVSRSSGVLTFTGGANGLSFTFEVTGVDITNGNIVFTPAYATVAYEGRNTYQQLKTLRLETPDTVYPYSGGAGVQIPVAGALYTSFWFDNSITRPDLQGQTVANGVISAKYSYLIYLNETNCATVIENISDWFNEITGAVEYAAVTVADAIIAETTDTDIDSDGTVTTT